VCRPPLLAGFAVHHFQELPSTNDKALEMVRHGIVKRPAVVLAEAQTHGRGRRGRTWESGGSRSTGLTVSFILPECPLPAGLVPLWTAEVVRRALAGWVDVRIKWPNDLLLRGRKLAGLLCERSTGFDVLGVGINLDPPGVDHAVGLREVTGPTPERNEVLASLATGIRTLDPHSGWLDDYRRHLLWVGRRVLLDNTPGRLDGITDDGRLLLDNRPHATGTLRPDPAEPV
jgi:BirA family biotin operon repressor/biotin-[acetyl-CoA-carboxylase] ligase